MPPPVQTLPASNQASITDLLAQLDKMIGGGKTTSSSTTTPDAGAVDQENLMLQKIFADINPDSLDAMVGNILERAKQTFGPAAISANAGGVRAYSDTVLASLRNEAMARATGEAAQAKIDAITKANQTAAGLVNNRLNSSKTTNATSKTGPSTLGQAAGLLSLGSAGMNIYKKLKDLYQPNAIGDGDLASGGEGFINDAENYASTDGEGGITSVEAGNGGTGTVASAGSTTVVPPASTFAMDSSPFLSADAMTAQTNLAQQGLEGMGELSEVPMLSLPSEAEMQVLNQQAAQAFEGTGELSEIPALGGGSLDQAIASLPGGEEMAGLSDAANLGTQGAGELSEVPALSDQPSPGAGTPTENLTSTTTGVTSGAESVIGADVGTPIDQILSQQGLTQGSAMPAAIVPAATGAAGVIGADVGTPIESILGSQGLTEGSAMPAATAPSAAGGATTAGTGETVAAGGEEVAATEGADVAGASAGLEGLGPFGLGLAAMFSVFGDNSLGLFDDDSPKTWMYNPTANTYHNLQTGEGVHGDVFADPNNGYSAAPTVNGQEIAPDENGQYQLPEGFSSWQDVWDAKSSYDTAQAQTYSM